MLLANKVINIIMILILEKFTSMEQVRDLDLSVFEKVARVCKNVRENLSQDKALIGFSGSPFTLACYI